MTVSAFPWGQVAILSASVEGAQRRFTQPEAREGRAYTVNGSVTSLPVLNSSFIAENALDRSAVPPAAGALLPEAEALPPEAEALLPDCTGWETG